MVAVVLALTVGFRNLLKRGFIPTLIIMILVGIVYQTGLFEWATTKYEDRITEETGRELLWPAAIERIFSSPATFLFGVGEPQVGMNVLTARVGSRTT